MRIKTIIAASAALSLTACGLALVWKSTIEGAGLTSAVLQVATDSTSNTYQLYPVDTQLTLRKLDTKGVVLWQQTVDAAIVDSLSTPKLAVTALGAAVGYQDAANKLAFVKQFDGDGNTLWQSDLGTHTSETLNDMTTGSDGSLTLAIKISSTQTNALRYDSTGAQLWDTALPKCFLLCTATVGVNADGDTLVNNTEAAATKSYFLDNTGAIVWNKTKSTGLSVLGVIPNQIMATSTGFASIHPFVTWEYDLSGNLTWSLSIGSKANLAQDSSGNLYIPNGTKVSKVAVDGSPLSEILLTDQIGISQIAWREDLQRLIVMSQYETVGPEIDGTITDESGSTVFVFDAAGVKKASYKSKATLIKTTVCTPYPECTTITVIPGETWGSFATTPDKKIVVSGLIKDSSRFAAAYKLP